MQDQIEAFLTYLRNEKSAADHTIFNYRLDLKQWARFLSSQFTEQPDLEQATDLKLLREFLAEEIEKYERSTIHRRVSVLKGFFKFLYREGTIKNNLSRLIQLPKIEEKLPFILKPEQVAKLLDGIAPFNLRTKRVRAILELLYSAGLRVSEVTSLTRDAVNLSSGFVRVRGKGDKERIVPIGRHCVAAMSDYLSSLPPHLKHDQHSAFFLNQDSEPLSVRTVQRNVREFAIEILGSDGAKVTPHTFRHSCASHLLASGAGLREIQELLGHRSLVATQKYTQVDVERLKRAYETSHPKGVLRQERDSSDKQPDLD